MSIAHFLPWIGAGILVVSLGLWFSRAPHAGLYLLIISIPLSYKPVLKGSPFYFITELVLLPFLYAVFLKHRARLQSLWTSPFMLLMPYLGFLALSSLWAAHLPSVAKEIIRWGEFILAGLAVSQWMGERPDLSKPIMALAWVGVVVSIVGATEFQLGINQNIYRPGAAAFFGHPNPTAAFLSLCTLPLLGLLIRARGTTLLLRTVVFIVLLLGLAFTFSRGVLLASGVGGLFFLYSLCRTRPAWNRRAAMLLAGTLLVLIALLGIQRYRVTALNRYIVKPVLSDRESILALGWSLYKEHPWIGLGAGNLKPYASKHQIQVFGNVPFEPNVGDLHNLYLQIAVESGSIGLLLFLFGIAGYALVLLRGTRHVMPTDKSLFLSISAASITFLIANLSAVYTIKGIQIPWAILLGLQVVMLQRSDTHDA
jgi:O-antigen ligase